MSHVQHGGFWKNRFGIATQNFLHFSPHLKFNKIQKCLEKTYNYLLVINRLKIYCFNNACANTYIRHLSIIFITCQQIFSVNILLVFKSLSSRAIFSSNYMFQAIVLFVCIAEIDRKTCTQELYNGCYY